MCYIFIHVHVCKINICSTLEIINIISKSTPKGIFMRKHDDILQWHSYQTHKRQ